MLGNISEFCDGLADAIDHGDSIGVATLLQHGQIDRALPIDANYVALNCGGIFGAADIANTDGRLADHFQGKVVDLFERRQLAVGIDVVIERADGHVASRQDEVRIVD